MSELQDGLLEKRLLTTIDQKSPPWTETDIIDVLKSLKLGKSRDPLGLDNLLFKPPLAGADLVKSLTIMMNSVKDHMTVPDLFRRKNITTIWKNRGSRLNLENDRGIFNGTILNNILQKLIYKAKYNVIDENMSDAQIGARK